MVIVPISASQESYNKIDYLNLVPNLFIKKEINNIGTEKKPNIIFEIGGCKKGAIVSWQVTGIRKDRFALTNPIITEVRKEKAEYIHPELWK